MPVVVTVAEPGPGKKLCPYCGGKGAMSAYEEGVRSLMHEPELAAPVDCLWCDGTGLVPEDFTL